MGKSKTVQSPTLESLKYIISGERPGGRAQTVVDFTVYELDDNDDKRTWIVDHVTVPEGTDEAATIAAVEARIRAWYREYHDHSEEDAQRAQRLAGHRGQINGG